ncbi:histidine phosphatase family protein [Streptomyces sp. NBC_01538]|uniref:histidine phosphatase family protein n=1 Tax=Streptomyces sp. NBC_01538 TaxID=2903897 RepID=UPI00386A881B
MAGVDAVANRADQTDVFLLRHGTPDYPVDTYPDPFQMPLSARGRQEARVAAAAVARLQPDAIFSSDFRRAVETAELATAVLTGIEIHLSAALRERVLYQLVDQSHAGIASRHGAAADLLFSGRSDFVDLPGEESYSDARQRAVAFVKALGDTYAGRRVLLVGHGGPHAWLMEEALGVDLRGNRSFALYPGCFSWFTMRSGTLRIEAMNLPPVGVCPALLAPDTV